MDLVLTKEEVKRLLAGGELERFVATSTIGTVCISIEKEVKPKPPSKRTLKIVYDKEDREMVSSLRLLLKIMVMKQHKDAILHRLEIHDGKVRLTESIKEGRVLIIFSDLYTHELEISDGFPYGWKARKFRLKKVCEKISHAKIVDEWDHTSRGFSITLDRKIPKSFLKCVQNYRNFKCPQCMQGVFCKCGVLTKKRNLFKNK